MKKMLGKRFMFLVALLVGLCMPTMAQTTVTKTFAGGESTTGNIDENGIFSYTAVRNGNSNTRPKTGESSGGYYYLQFYNNNKLTIKSNNSNYKITKVVFTTAGGNYAINEGNLTTSLSGSTITVNTSQNQCTVNISNGTQEIPLTCVKSGNNGVRLISIAVTYTTNAPVDPTFNLGVKVGNQNVTSRPVTLTVDGTAQLSITTNSTGQKSYSSSNDDVVIVDNSGKVTAVGAGEANITASVAAVQNQYNKKSETVTFKVNRKTDSPSLTAGSEVVNKTLTVGKKTQLVLTTENKNGSVKYESSNDAIATVSTTGLVTAVGAGEVTITATIGETAQYAESTATFTFTVNAAPSTPENLDGNGATVYYIRNVSTGLYIKYGGSYGMDAIEGRAAHPFKLYSKGNNVYALASIHGYFNSMYSNSSLFLDRPEGESNWKLELVENTADVYYLRGENGYALASVGNQYGILELRKYDTKDIYQKWQLITEDKLFAEMQGATVADPVDITPFIKGAAFDYADHVIVTNKETAEDAGDDPFFYNEIYDLAGNTWNSTPVASRMVSDGAGREDAERSEWELTHTYSNNWDGFQRMQHYSAMWSDDQYAPANMNLNGIGLSRNNIHNEYVVEQYIGDLPAGTYTFSYQGFYHVRRATGILWWTDSESYSVGNNEIPTISIEIPTSETTSTTLKSQQFKNYTMSHDIVTSSGANRGYEVATMFRDNRENDSYRNSIEFTLTEDQPVVIRIRKPNTDPEYLGRRLQWILAFDDFTLIYKGNGSTVIDQAILYYDRVKAAYEYYSKKVSELGEPASYTGCHLDGCVHWTAWDNAINGVVTVNGLNLRGNEYTTPSQKFAYLNGTAASNKIDTEKEFLEALSKIEAAYQAAYAEHLSHATDITKETISDPSFENGGTGWTIGHDGSVATISGQTGEGLHGSKMYTTGNNGQNTWTGPVSQVLTGLEPGLYSLQASFATAGNTAYLVANGYYSGVSSSSFDTFVDHELLFLVETTQDVRIAAVGHNNPYAVDYPLYGPHYFPGSGSSFRVDNFRLKRVADLPQGRVQLALADVDAIQIDDYAKEAAFADENSLQAYRINTYTDDAAAKTAVADIYARFRNTVKAQKTKNADMTYAISDPSFEHGIADAWEFSEFTDEGWGENDVFAEDRFIFTGSTGRKVFNTWQGGNASGPISQKITGIPNGRYRVTAVMASDQNVAVLTANGVKSPEEALYTGDNNIGKLISVETQVTDHTLEISAEAKEGKWYKVDNFRLTYIGHELALNHEVNPSKTIKDWYTDVNLTRNIPVGTWQSFIVPFDMEIPENWDVRDFRGVTLDETGVHLSLIFSEAGEVTKIEAGKPYMVRNDGAADLPAVVVEYKDVETADETLKPQVQSLTQNYTGDVTFTGNYGSTTIPKGAFYISKNKFYIASKDITMKGYRAFFNPDEFVKSTVKSLGMRTRTETLIESVEVDDIEKVVAIYNVNGVQIEKMQSGVNILRMSNGATKKVIVK